MKDTKYIKYSEKIPVGKSYDVLIAGGGVAGCAAALSAARQGMHVLLLEKSITLGGLATLGLINYFEPLCDGRGRQILSSMTEEFLRLSIKYGYDTLPSVWRDKLSSNTTEERYATVFSPNLFALALMELLTDAGVQLLLDCKAMRPVMRDGCADGVIADCKEGCIFYPSKMIVDATGDADLLAAAGIPTISGKNFFTYVAQGVSLESCARAVESGRIDRALFHVHGGNATLYGEYQPEDRKLYDGLTAAEITEYIVENQKLLLEKYKHSNRYSCDIATLPGMPQFRTTRRIDGDYVLTMDDAFKRFDDSIGVTCDFDHRDTLMEIPYRALMRTGYHNIITCGRTISASGYAWDLTRVIPPAILTGQAAGISAAVAVQSGKSIDTLDISEVQRRLDNAGVMIHDDNILKWEASQ